MTLSDAIVWARTCDADDYLVRYADSGLSDDEDPGSRCGFDDSELAEIESALRGRDLTLTADDRGLCVSVALEGM